MMAPGLYNAPPRLSDLAPDDLRLVANRRHRTYRDDWLRARAVRPLATRIADLFRPIPRCLGRAPLAASTTPAGAFEARAGAHRYEDL